MSRSATIARVTAAVVVFGSMAWLLVTLPPRAIPAAGGQPPAPRSPHVRGVIHVHTVRSDGSGSIDEVARAASRAGLDFLVITDHGNGMALQPATYRSGVLCIDAVEVSTRDGHLVAIGLDPSPYPLAGEGRDVVDDVHRLGGMAFAAHPTSPKEALAWNDWNVPLDGFEWLNADSEWRDETRAGLAATLTHYLFRGPESIAALFSQPSALLARWDQFSREGRLLTTYVGADAHARLGETEEDARPELADVEPTRWMLRVPSYETVFRVISVGVELTDPLIGRADVDAAAIIGALKAGRTYSMIDGFARGGVLEFHGEANGDVVRMGERVEAGQLARLTVRALAPVTTTLRLLRNGEVVAETSGVSLDVSREQLGRSAGSERATAYRVDAFLGTHARPGAAPWMVSNPIFEVAGRSAEGPAHDAERGRAAGAPGPDQAERLAQAGEWAVEKDGLSRGQLQREGVDAPARLDFALGPGRGSRWVAVAIPLADRVAADLAGAVVVRLRADVPMRASLQLRATSETQDLRWVRSIYVDSTARLTMIPLSSMRPVGPAAAAGAIGTASSLLVVVDQTNTPPGTRGTLWIDNLSTVSTRSER